MADGATAAMGPVGPPPGPPTGGKGGPGSRSTVMIVSAVLVIGLAAGIGIALALSGGSDSDSKSAASSSSSSSTTSSTTSTTAARSGGGGGGNNQGGGSATTPPTAAPTAAPATTTPAKPTITAANVNPMIVVCHLGEQVQVTASWASANANNVQVGGGNQAPTFGDPQGALAISFVCTGQPTQVTFEPLRIEGNGASVIHGQAIVIPVSATVIP
jgi:hypothetical protein